MNLMTRRRALMVMPDGFSIEANTRYEINVSNGYAVVGSWEVSSS